MQLTGPATDQVIYSWEKYVQTSSSISTGVIEMASPPAVLMLVKRDERELTKVFFGRGYCAIDEIGGSNTC